MSEYQPKTGARCTCKRGVQRDNCSTCEGTGWVIDFAKIRSRYPLPACGDPEPGEAMPRTAWDQLPGDNLPSASCPTCGADTKPSSTYPWHYPDEDCRAIRKPGAS